MKKLLLLTALICIASCQSKNEESLKDLDSPQTVVTPKEPTEEPQTPTVPEEPVEPTTPNEPVKEYDIPDNIPTCIADRIQAIKSSSVWNPPAKIWQYRYNGQTAYYTPPRCCDIPSILMDENCNVICSPDGGESGGGDGKCTDFFEKRTDEKLIWEDERTK